MLRHRRLRRLLALLLLLRWPLPSRMRSVLRWRAAWTCARRLLGRLLRRFAALILPVCAVALRIITFVALALVVLACVVVRGHKRRGLTRRRVNVKIVAHDWRT